MLQNLYCLAGLVENQYSTRRGRSVRRIEKTNGALRGICATFLNPTPQIFCCLSCNRTRGLRVSRSHKKKTVEGFRGDAGGIPPAAPTNPVPARFRILRIRQPQSPKIHLHAILSDLLHIDFMRYHIHSR